MHWLFRRVALGLVVVGVAVPATFSAQDPVDALFEAYRAGRYEAVWAQLASTDDWGDLRDAIEDREGVWPAEARAAFTLEAAMVAQRVVENINRYRDEVGLFKDACEIVRGLPQGGAFEAAWHDAALAMLAADFVRGIDFEDHMKHVRDRIDPGRWALAAVRPREENAWAFLRDYQPDGSGLDDRRGRIGRVYLRLVLDHLETAQSIDTVRAEAMLRRGALLAESGEPAAGLELLVQVPPLTTDTRLQHLALLHAGRAYLATGDRQRARSALDEALARIPDSRSGLLLLASLEFAENHRAEADRLTRRALETDEHDDPWIAAFDVEWRALPDKLTSLREALR